jgi:hypothetical protein
MPLAVGSISIWSVVGQLEASMNVRTVYGALILAGSIVAAQPSSSQAQTTDPVVSTPKQAATPAPSTSPPDTNTNTNPTKHRHWRHRGGSHPHYGSRRVRT